MRSHKTDLSLHVCLMLLLLPLPRYLPHVLLMRRVIDGHGSHLSILSAMLFGYPRLLAIIRLGLALLSELRGLEMSTRRHAMPLLSLHIARSISHLHLLLLLQGQTSSTWMLRLMLLRVMSGRSYLERSVVDLLSSRLVRWVLLHMHSGRTSRLRHAIAQVLLLSCRRLHLHLESRRLLQRYPSVFHDAETRRQPGDTSAANEKDLQTLGEMVARSSNARISM